MFILQYFTGNRDQNTVVTNSFVPILRCRYIRVHPRKWYKHISMRVEFYGCLTGILYNYLLGFSLKRLEKSTVELIKITPSYVILLIDMFKYLNPQREK